MSGIRDYACVYDDSEAVRAEAAKKKGLQFPDAYLYGDAMAEWSLAIREQSGASFCELPFCHTVEAEALGAKIRYGDAWTGLRAGAYICTSPEELLELPPIDFSRGRIREVLHACRKLCGRGEQVLLQISGPFTILNGLIDVSRVFRAVRKRPELMRQVFWKLGGELLRFVEEARDCGVQLVSYADAPGGVGILGPKLAGQIVEDFTYPFLKEAVSLTEGKMLFLLCPKTTCALTGTKRAEFREWEVGRISYGEACTVMIGRAKMAGQTCIKNAGNRLEKGIFKEVVLV